MVGCRAKATQLDLFHEGKNQLDLLMVIFPIGNPLLGQSIVFSSPFFHAFLKQIQDQGELKKVKVQPNVQEVYTVYT